MIFINGEIIYFQILFAWILVLWVMAMIVTFESLFAEDLVIFTILLIKLVMRVIAIIDFALFTATVAIILAKVKKLAILKVIVLLIPQ